MALSDLICNPMKNLQLSKSRLDACFHRDCAGDRTHKKLCCLDICLHATPIRLEIDIQIALLLEWTSSSSLFDKNTLVGCTHPSFYTQTVPFRQGPGHIRTEGFDVVARTSNMALRYVSVLSRVEVVQASEVFCSNLVLHCVILSIHQR